jgi:Carboxypeptidase regulatory-like domain
VNWKRAGRGAAVLAAACGAGLGSAGAVAAAPQTTVAWGTTTSAPAGALGQLFGVAAASSTDVLAVGGFNPGQPPTAVLTRPYAEHWAGAGWTATTVPLGAVYPSGQQAARLNGVTEAAPGNGWAVGTVSDLSSLASQTLAFHWDGTAWTRSPTPDPAGPKLTNQLNAVAARAASDVWAAGGDGGNPASLVLHFNGSAWRQVSVPNIGTLDAVAVAPGRVWVAGGDHVEQFNGTAWTTLPVPPVPAQDFVVITGLAHTAAGLWAVGNLEFTCGEGGTCTNSYAALWNGTAWARLQAGGGTGLTGVAAAGSQVLATFQTGVVRLSLTGATTEVTPALNGQLTAIAADPAGNPCAAGSKITNPQGTDQPAIINAPGIGQGGIIVTTGAANATVTWTGPVTGSGGTDVSGRFAVGGLPDGTYTVTASLPGCQPGIATATVTAGVATPVSATVTCPP